MTPATDSGGFAWIITADHVLGIKAGMIGPEALTPIQQAALLTPGVHLHRFHLYGPDGERMYDGYGTWTHPEDEGTEPGLFAPLAHTWMTGVDQINWPQFPDEADPVQLALDLPTTARQAPDPAPDPDPDRLMHLLAVQADLAQLMPAEELTPRITNNPELTPTERAAALHALQQHYAPAGEPRA